MPNSSWSTGFTMTGQYVPNAFRQDACPLLLGTSYLGVIPNGEEIVIYGCPDTDGDGYADLLESPSNELDQVNKKEDGLLGFDLDLIGIALSIIIPFCRYSHRLVLLESKTPQFREINPSYEYYR